MRPISPSIRSPPEWQMSSSSLSPSINFKAESINFKASSGSERFYVRQSAGRQQDVGVTDVMVVSSREQVQTRSHQSRLGAQDFGDRRQPFVVPVLHDAQCLSGMADDSLGD